MFFKFMVEKWHFPMYNIFVKYKIYTRRDLIMTSVTKDTLIGDILDFDLETAEYFFEIGMHCLGCPASRGESIAEACMVHGTNADELVAKINAHLAKKA